MHYAPLFCLCAAGRGLCPEGSGALCRHVCPFNEPTNSCFADECLHPKYSERSHAVTSLQSAVPVRPGSCDVIQGMA